jgi:superfamily II DNA or RNA helicase
LAILEDLVGGVRVRGVIGDRAVTVVDAARLGQQAVNLTYRIEETGDVGSRLLYRADEASIEIVEAGAHWAFDAPGDRFRLTMEAMRLDLAHLFDPLLALSTSQVETLPHQIGAVYETMLHRQPLRFLLADDPGAGKTIMAGLLIKELMLRGDVERCLIVVPASLEVQWQDELYEKFKMDFRILGRGEIENAKTNAFAENNLVIARIDMLKQDEQMARLEDAEWDLVVVDEAHKMSATYDPSGEKRRTGRYKLGQLLAHPDRTRHLLLMTATPHRGKEADFQLFMQLLDEDRFEGRYRQGVHHADVSDLMRRLLKEEMVDFEGHRLFPERRAQTVTYALSEAERELYSAVTTYVTEEMNRADTAAQAEGGQGNSKRAVVGFALTTLQRRLASSPNAIYRSLERRRKRLEGTLEEVRTAQRQADRAELLGGAGISAELTGSRLGGFDAAELEDELDDRPDDERDAIVDAASAARTVAELEREIGQLRDLERRARVVVASAEDSKWVQLSDLLQNGEEMRDPRGKRRKLVVFTEHRDTLDYLHGKIGVLLGDPEAVVTIHGGMGREERRRAQELFVNDPDVLVLVATDAAGEGINLQRAHLMVNYDLPWNPNRIEQRFGRIHRYGQREVCHLWNLVAEGTREGDVFATLFRKLEVEADALGGRVFDVLGSLFEGESLRDLLLEAIRYGDDPKIRAKWNEVLEGVASRKHFEEVLREQALNAEHFGAARLAVVKDLMQRATVNRLVPHFIASFFREAFESLGGSISQREPGRFEITHVPSQLRNRSKQRGGHTPLLRRYERVCFDKKDIAYQGRPDASFVAPGHPLLDLTIEAVLERGEGILRRGTVLVDPRPEGEGVRAVFCIRHDITDGHTDARGRRRVISSELHFVEIGEGGEVRGTVQAPYLDYRPLRDGEVAVLGTRGRDDGSTPAFAGGGNGHLRQHAPSPSEVVEEWRHRDLEGQAVLYAVEHLVPAHAERVKEEREALVDKAKRQVWDRLTKEIMHWNGRAEDLKQKELAGKKPRLNSGRAWERAEGLKARRGKRMAELELERQVVPQAPVLVAGALIGRYEGLQHRLGQHERADHSAVADPEAKRRTELAAMAAVMAWEAERGYAPRDVSRENLGYDVESRDPVTGRLRFIEVKGRDADADTLTLTRNECMSGLNLRDDFWLAIVRARDGVAQGEPEYVRDAAYKVLVAEPRFPLVSVQVDMGKILALA